MGEVVLITGGAGFIGSHLSERLLSQGRAVRILDSLEPQVHGDRVDGLSGGLPPSLPEIVRQKAEFLLGDVADPAIWAQALAGTAAIVHLAAAVGVGQSMYQIDRYSRSNIQGTATMLQALLEHRSYGASGEKSLPRLVLASSMSIYGEGAYRCDRCGPVEPLARSRAQLVAGRWEPWCPRCGGQLTPAPTHEEKPLSPQSVYAVTKLTQEQLVLNFARAYDIPCMALRLFNVYGPGQALGNPYTGVVAIFCARLAARMPLVIYEDGEQRRDFVSVHDVVAAFLAALDAAPAPPAAFNIASGAAISIAALAASVADAVDGPLTLERRGRSRAGDIRHCIADIGAARRELGYSPAIELGEGLRELAAWLHATPPRRVPPSVAAAELEAFGLSG